MGSLRVLISTLPLLLACGGAVDPTPAPGGKPSRTVAPGPDPSPSASGGPTSTLAPPPPPPPGIDLPAPSKVGDPPGSGDTAFHLVVSNQSPEAGVIGLDILIDGAPVVSGGFSPTTSYTFDFALAPGPHSLKLKAAASSRSTAAEETLPFDLVGERWGSVRVSTVRCDPCSSPVIDWKLEETAPAR